MNDLRIKHLKLANVGTLKGTFDLGDFSGRITLITGPNEVGKSTVVAAIRAVLFERHDAGHKGLKALQPYGTKAHPEVWLAFTLGDARYDLYKKFLNPGASAELTIQAPGRADEILTGLDVDERLWADLSASRPGNRGVGSTDMGIWGLLWVTQDEAAFQDPSVRLGDNARGALHEVIGRQVGQVVGGPQGDALRAKVQVEFERYWTPTGRATGELSQATSAAATARAECNDIQKAILDVEAQASTLAADEVRLLGLKAQRPRLEAAQREAAVSAQVIEGLTMELALAGERMARAVHDAEVSERAHTDRVALGAALTRKTQATTQATETLGALQGTLDRATSEQAAAAARGGAAAAALAQARGRWNEARGACDGGRRRAGRATLMTQLAEVRGLEVRRDALRVTRSETLDEARWAQISGLAAKVEAAYGDLEREGTRLEVTAGGIVEPLVFGRRRHLEVEGLGSVLVEPSTAELPSARLAAQAAARRLEDTLRTLGIDTVVAAREAAAARQMIEGEHAEIVQRLSAVAPDGLAALSASLLALKDKQDERSARLEAAQGAAARVLEETEGLASSQGVSGARWADLQGLVARREALLTTRDAVATKVEVRALSSFELRRDEAAVAFDERGHAQLQLTDATVLRLGDLAEVHVVPGGADLQGLAARLAEVEASVAEGLAAMGVEDLEAARAAVLAREAAEAGLQEARGRRDALAPDGVGALETAARQAREAYRSMTEQHTIAGPLHLRGLTLRATLDVDAFTAPALALVEAAEVTRGAAEAALVTCAAALTVDGVRHVCVEVTEGTRGAASWRLVPGVGGLDAQARHERGAEALTQALEGAGAQDLEDARRRWTLGLEVGPELRLVEEGLAARAPEGVPAMAAALEAMGGAVEVAEAPNVEAIQALEAAGEAAQREVEGHERAQAEAQRAMDDARSAHGEVATAHAEAKAAAQVQAAGLDEVRARLAAGRAQASDEALAAAQAEGAPKVAQQGALKAKAETALAAQNPDLAAGASQASDESLAAHDQRLEGLHDQIVRARTHLELAAAEGHFERLGDAKVTLTLAVARLAQVTRDAGAVKHLSALVEVRYAEVQRRLVAPVIKEVSRYLPALRPGSRLTMTPELAIGRLVRAGAEEEFSHLSGGTREQLSVIVRLAIARVLAHDGAALPLVLDDTMGWTDDARFQKMMRILSDAANEMQMVILTCHPGRFDQLNADTEIDLRRLRDAVAR